MEDYKRGDILRNSKEYLTSAQMIQRGGDTKIMLENDGWKWLKDDLSKTIAYLEEKLSIIAAKTRDIDKINDCGITIQIYKDILNRPELYINEGKRVNKKEINKGGKNNGR